MKIQLLEYLDKLEAAATVSPGVLCSINGAIAAALIAKLREAVQLAKDLSVDIWEHPMVGEIVKAALQRKIDALHEIEVPE